MALQNRISLNIFNRLQHFLGFYGQYVVFQRFIHFPLRPLWCNLNVLQCIISSVNFWYQRFDKVITLIFSTLSSYFVNRFNTWRTNRTVIRARELDFSFSTATTSEGLQNMESFFPLKLTCSSYARQHEVLHGLIAHPIN